MIIEYFITNAVEHIHVKNYHARAQVIALDTGRSKVVWSCKAEAHGAYETHAEADTQELYKAMLSWIDDFLKK